MDEGRSEPAIDYFHLQGPDTGSVVVDMVGNRPEGPNGERQLRRLTVPISLMSESDRSGCAGKLGRDRWACDRLVRAPPALVLAGQKDQSGIRNTNQLTIAFGEFRSK